MKSFILAALVLGSICITAQGQEKSLYDKYCYTQNGELGWKRQGDGPFDQTTCDSMGSGDRCGSENGGLCVGSSGKLGECVERGTWPDESSECVEFGTY